MHLFEFSQSERLQKKVILKKNLKIKGEQSKDIGKILAEIEKRKDDIVELEAEPNDVVLPILMPQAGQSMEEGTLLKWHVAEGDWVKAGQVLFEVETDKAVVEVEAEGPGHVARIVVQEDEIVDVLTPVAYMAVSDEAVDRYLASQPGSAPLQTPAAEKAPASVTPDDTPPTPKGAVEPILMPQAGQSMEEGTLLKWHVAEGDRIEVGQVIFEVETDKAAIEVEAEKAGRVARIVAQEDDIVDVLTPVAYMAENDADVDAFLTSSVAVPASAPKSATQATAPSTESAKAKPSAQTTVQQSDRAPGERVKASPAARKNAAEKGIDLNQVAGGSGPGGRIISNDLEGVVTSTIPVGEPIRTPMTKMRRAIARSLTASKQNVPHFYMRLTIDATPLMAFYQARRKESKCSLNDAIMMACGLALIEYPAMRSQVHGDDIIEFPSANIGVAVGTDKGLLVPVVLGVERMSFQELAIESRRVVEAARNGILEGVGQAVFTISNLGMFDVEEFSAIINPPEAAILAVGGIREEVIVEEGRMRAGHVMTMTLSCDHRVVDGLVAAKFAQRLKEILEGLVA